MILTSYTICTSSFKFCKYWPDDGLFRLKLVANIWNNKKIVVSDRVHILFHFNIVHGPPVKPDIFWTASIWRQSIQLPWEGYHWKRKVLQCQFLWSSGALNTTRSSWRCFFKNDESVTLTQRKFRLHFNVVRHGRIPSRNTVLLWVHNLCTTASATKKKQGGSARTVRTPENV